MRNLYVLVILFLIFSLNALGQSKKLLFIDGMPVKIDGGCSFFVTADHPVSTLENQLTIDANNTAFLELKPKTFVFFKRIKRIKNRDGYIDYFKNSLGSLILNIDFIQKSPEFVTIRSGTLKVTYPGFYQMIKVHGAVQAFDSFYHDLYK